MCTENNIVLIFDEFQGLGKLMVVFTKNTMFFLIYVALGKALGNGYAITAVIGKREIMESAQILLLAVLFGLKELDR